MALKIEFSRFAWSPYNWGNASSSSATIYARSLQTVYESCEKNPDRCCYALWSNYADSGAAVFVRLGPKNRKIVCNEEVNGTIYTQKAAPAINLTKIDAAQKNLVQQQENEKMSAQPKVSQSEPSSENLE